MDLNKILSTLTLIGANLPAYKALYDQVIAAFSEKDQAKLQEAYRLAMEENDAGFKRLEEKLAEAAKKE